ncbi:MAG: TlpA disulfide reductase family protein [Pseudomonadota bacterium]
MDKLRRMTAPVACLLCLAVLQPFSAVARELPAKGAALPEFQITAPIDAQDRQYLGISGDSFQIRDVDCRIIVVEIVGAYCPRCYEQAPLLNTLQKRLERAKLGEAVKMLAIAAGATQAEADMVRQQWGHRFPVVEDEKFSVHKLLGEPRTPFTLVADRQGRVLFVHAGTFQEIDGFYQTIKSLLGR